MTATLEKWSISHLLNMMILPKIRMVMVFGNSGNSCLIVTQDQMVYGIGNNSEGCLGIGNTENTRRPTKINELCEQNIKTFACGTAHVLALTKNGEVYAWGLNKSLQLGYSGESLVPKKVQIMEGVVDFVVDIACEANYSVALTNNGLVYAWGNDTVKNPSYYDESDSESDEFELANPFIKNVGLKTSNLIKCVSICCGCSHSMAVMNNGQVYGWGSNSEGQLGNGDKNSRHSSKPSQVINLNRIAIVKVVCGMEHTLALSDKGLLYSWGNNKYGQLGFPNVHQCSLPSQILKFSTVLDIAASNSSNISVAMGADNRIYTWGKRLGQSLAKPTWTAVDTIHDVFEFYTWPNVMHQPLVIGDDDNYDKEKEETTHVLNNLETAFDDKNVSDFTIEVEGKPIYVHKAILKIRSEYFQRMFEGPWKENSDSLVKEGQFCYVVYRTFLKFLYTGKIDIPAENAVELLQLADFYNDDHLKMRCVDIIMRGISTDNAAFIYSVAVKYNAMELKKLSIQFAVKNMTSVVESTSFDELPLEVMKTFITEANKFKVFNT